MNTIYIIIYRDNLGTQCYDEIQQSIGYFTNKQVARQYIIDNKLEFFTQDNECGYLVIELNKHI